MVEENYTYIQSPSLCWQMRNFYAKHTVTATVIVTVTIWKIVNSQYVVTYLVPQLRLCLPFIYYHYWCCWFNLWPLSSPLIVIAVYCTVFQFYKKEIFILIWICKKIYFSNSMTIAIKQFQLLEILFFLVELVSQ